MSGNLSTQLREYGTVFATALEEHVAQGPAGGGGRVVVRPPLTGPAPRTRNGAVLIAAAAAVLIAVGVVGYLVRSSSESVPHSGNSKWARWRRSLSLRLLGQSKRRSSWLTAGNHAVDPGI